MVFPCANVGGHTIDVKLLDAPWVWPSINHTHKKAACKVQPPGPWNVSGLDMPPSVLAASRAVKNSAGRLHTFLEKLNSEDCCTSVLVVGGSVPCGHGYPGCGGAQVMFANTSGSGLYGAWPTWLNRWLNWSRPNCCPSGHVVRNLCVGATGIDYILNTYSTRIQVAIAELPTQLVVVDTAVNDHNEYFYVKRCQWHRCISAAERLRHDFETQVQTEALIRQLLLANLSVVFIENARFNLRDNSSQFTFGAWTSHEPILRHYGIPTVHLGLAAKAADMEALPRPDLWVREWTHVDAQHLSAGGHWATAMLLTQGLLCDEWLMPEFNSPTFVLPSLPTTYHSQGQLEPYLGATSAPSTLIDFTDLRESWNRSVVPPMVPPDSPSPLEHAWGWAMAVKRVSGGYSLLPAGPAVSLAAAQASGEMGKLSFSVRAPVPCSFDATVIFMTGRLRVGYLRSYEGQASIEVQVFIPPSHGGIANASWVVNGTWEDRVSIYTSDDLELSEPLQSIIWPQACGYSRGGRCTRWINVSRWKVPARIHVTSIPRALDDNKWAPFSLYTMASY